MMKSKRIVILGITLILLVSVSVVYFCITSKPTNKEFQDKLVSVLENQQQTTVQDIFSFEFDRAYIFNDCYISGEGLAERYDLNISIKQVKTGVSENIQRIVFVDKHGKFVYEFKCDSKAISIPEKGLVIYPETVIEKTPSDAEKPLIISFRSTEHYDS